jgi:hypothetical protein
MVKIPYLTHGSISNNLETVRRSIRNFSSDLRPHHFSTDSVSVEKPLTSAQKNHFSFYELARTKRDRPTHGVTVRKQ